MVKGSNGCPAQRIVVLGTGFGGLYAALYLGQAFRRAPDVEIHLIGEHNYFLFMPMLHEAATGGLEPRHVALPVRRMLRKLPVRFHMAQVLAIDLEARQVETSRQTLDYDCLIVALGSTTNFFGLVGVETSALVLKNMADAIAIHNQIIACFERANGEPDPDRRRQMLTFVVAGAGPTGVELAAEIRGLAHGALQQDYPGVSLSDVRVVIVEAMDRILPGFDDYTVAQAIKYFESKGIELLLGGPITTAGEAGVQVRGHGFIPADTVIWTAGVAADPAAAALPAEKDRGGRLVVEPTLELPRHPGIYAIGDNASCLNPHSDRPYPPTAQVALRQAKHVAQNVVAALRDGEQKPFTFKPLGGLISLGERRAVVQFGKLRLSGILAWLMWRGFYLMRLPGWGNKLRVAVDWFLDLFVKRNTALIGWRSNRPSESPAEPGL
jgi:NADH dehydrogenase